MKKRYLSLKKLKNLVTKIRFTEACKFPWIRLEEIKLALKGSKRPKERFQPKRRYIAYRPPNLDIHCVTDVEVNYRFEEQSYHTNENWLCRLRNSLADN